MAEKRGHDARTIVERHQNWMRRAVLEGLDTGKVSCDMIEEGVILLDKVARLSNAVSAGLREGQGHPNAALQKVKRTIITAAQPEDQTVCIGVVVPLSMIQSIQVWWGAAVQHLETQVAPRPEVGNRNEREAKQVFKVEGGGDEQE